MLKKQDYDVCHVKNAVKNACLTCIFDFIFDFGCVSSGPR